MDVDAIRDVLDKQLVDAHGNRMGKVDGLVLEAAPGVQPRITTIRVGAAVWTHRLGGPVARLARAVSRWAGHEERSPYLIPWTEVKNLGRDVHLRVEADESPVLAWERRVRDRIVGRIPGAHR